MEKRIDRPIFLIGCPRSGTTVIVESLSRHPELGGFSHYFDKWPDHPWINIVNRFTNIPFFKIELKKGRRLFPFISEPTEAWNLWSTACGEKFLYSSLTKIDPTQAEKKSVSCLIEKTLAFQGKNRFIAKLTGPPRISYLKKIFPDALFINIIRDGRAVVHSLLNVSFWKDRNGYTRPWWHDFPEKYKEQWLHTGKKPSALAALEWKYIIELTELESRNLSSSDYLNVKYEDFTVNPVKFINSILHVCDLDYHKNIESQIKMLNVRTMNYKWKDTFQSEEIAMLDELLRDTLKEHGYLTS